ncbi:hypothetical protein TI05_01860 [Achromatium sp. WMS3]|nr:hypothetical protein TI05_01860 [Achromatium sp. WMS3]
MNVIKKVGCATKATLLIILDITASTIIHAVFAITALLLSPLIIIIILYYLFLSRKENAETQNVITEQSSSENVTSVKSPHEYLKILIMEGCQWRSQPVVFVTVLISIVCAITTWIGFILLFFSDSTEYWPSWIASIIAGFIFVIILGTIAVKNKQSM